MKTAADIIRLQGQEEMLYEKCKMSQMHKMRQGV